MQSLKILILSIAVMLAEVCAAADSFDIGGARSKREDVFEFAQKPSCKKVASDRYEIQFAVKGYCDIAVGILDRDGKIVRHLVAGVLGSNAPDPLQKDSLNQKLIWDGKNDFDRYVEEPLSHHVQVSLGLKPVFDKMLPKHHMQLSWAVFGLAADENGVYVFNSGGLSTLYGDGHQRPDLTHILQFDHAGNYQRTLLPLANDRMNPNLYTQSAMHGQPKSIPAKALEGPPYAFMLPSEKLIVSPTNEGKYFKEIEPNSFCLSRGNLMAVALSSESAGAFRVFQLKTDGSMPASGFYSKPMGKREGVGPCWMAASPDGKWFYFSGLGSKRARLYDYGMRFTYAVADRKEIADHAVYRVSADFETPLAAPFLGKLKQAGNDNDHFSFAEGVACDASGRIYVADRGNNRVQVFEADGKFLKSISVPEPVHTAIHPTTGAIYTLSFLQKLNQVKLTKFNNVNELKVQCEQVITSPRDQVIPTFCLDCWAGGDTIVWLTDEEGNVQLWKDKAGKFELFKDLFSEWKKESKSDFRETPDGPISADPYHPYLYCGKQRIQTETGAVEAAPQELLAVGYDGLGYQRHTKISRFELTSWKPVAFDYGEDDNGSLFYRYTSDASIGFGVSPSGEVAYHDRWPPVPGLSFDLHPADRGGMNLPSYMINKKWGDGGASIDGYHVRQLYPGRVYHGSSAIILFDGTGQVRTNDAIAGLPRVSSGLRLDTKGSIYVGVPMSKLVDGKEISGFSLVKFPASGGKFIVNGPGVPVPLKDVPQRPADFKPYYGSGRANDVGPNGETGYGDKVWAESMLWSFGGFYPFNNDYCICLNARFDLDLYARCFVPESFRNSIAVIDPNGNFILRLGTYGNQDDRGPEIRLAHCRYVAATDSRLYLNDSVNRRIVSIDLKYETFAQAEIAP